VSSDEWEARYGSFICRLLRDSVDRRWRVLYECHVQTRLPVTLKALPEAIRIGARVARLELNAALQALDTEPISDPSRHPHEW
jgi:hypothetical protein